MQYIKWQVVGYLGIGLGLTACDPPPVEVSFAQPFPVGTADAAGFLPGDQGQYQDATDTSSTLVVGKYWLLTRRFTTDTLRAAQLDSLGLPHQAGLGLNPKGQPYQLRALGATHFQLRREARDTVASLLGQHGARVRRYQGWYYLSKPAAGGQWQVERLGLVTHRLHWQYFNPDSLRIRALQPQMVRLARDNQQLLFTLNPRPGRQTRQVNSYAGLWLTIGEFLPKK